MARMTKWLLVVMAGGIALVAQSPPAPRTMRVDYFHTGGASAEVFALDAVVIEPAPWAGPARPVEDSLRYGAYGFDVRDAGSKRLLYSAGFGSIYDEWVTTEEAKAVSRTFHESVRFPEPAAAVTVTMVMPRIEEAFRTGEGIPFGDYGPYVVEAQAGLNRPVYENLLGGEYLPSIPDLDARLRAEPPARVLDLACGAGWSSIAIARAGSLKPRGVSSGRRSSVGTLKPPMDAKFCPAADMNL